MVLHTNIVGMQDSEKEPNPPPVAPDATHSDQLHPAGAPLTSSDPHLSGPTPSGPFADTDLYFLFANINARECGGRFDLIDDSELWSRMQNAPKNNWKLHKNTAICRLQLKKAPSGPKSLN